MSVSTSPVKKSAAKKLKFSSKRSSNLSTIPEVKNKGTVNGYPVMKWDNSTWVHVPAEYHTPLRDLIGCAGDSIDVVSYSARTGALLPVKMLRGAIQRVDIMLGQENQRREHINPVTMTVANSESNRKIALLMALKVAWAETMKVRPE